MEMTVKANENGKIKKIYVKANSVVESGDLIIETEWDYW